MKTALPARSSLIKTRLDNVVKEILDVAGSKTAMIILFGSYARGDWVQDEYQKEHTTYSYQSDLDILLVLNKSKDIGHASLRIDAKIEKRLKQKSLRDPFSKEPWVTIIIESIDNVNKQLENGHYFFSDIKKEGIILYDSKEFKLTEYKSLPWHRKRLIAQKDYNYWFKRGRGFLKNCKYQLEEDDDNPLSAFLLHQATECFYNTILLVFSGYKPKLHDIKKLGSIAGNYSEELWKIFPLSNAEQSMNFELLKRAYIEARYEQDYIISTEQLLYLIQRVEILKTVTEEICLARINKPGDYEVV